MRSGPSSGSSEWPTPRLSSVTTREVLGQAAEEVGTPVAHRRVLAHHHHQRRTGPELPVAPSDGARPAPCAPARGRPGHRSGSSRAPRCCSAVAGVVSPTMLIGLSRLDVLHAPATATRATLIAISCRVRRPRCIAMHPTVRRQGAKVSGTFARVVPCGITQPSTHPGAPRHEPVNTRLSVSRTVVVNRPLRVDDHGAHRGVEVVGAPLFGGRVLVGRALPDLTHHVVAGTEAAPPHGDQLVSLVRTGGVDRAATGPEPPHPGRTAAGCRRRPLRRPSST